MIFNIDTFTQYQDTIILFAIFLVLHFFIKFTLKALSKLATKTTTNLDDYLVSSLDTPAKVLLWLTFIRVALGQLQLSSYTQYVDIIVAIAIMWIVIKVISSVEKYLINDKDTLDSDLVRFMMRFIKIIAIVVVGLSIMQFFGFEISSVLTFGGVGGMVLGFAAKDMLANIFGGLMISLDRPFSVGDWIRVGDVEGTVETIGWRMTTVRTFSKNPIYVPNSMFSTQHIETPSRMTNRRIREVIGLRYDDIEILPTIVLEIENYLKNNEKIDTNALTMVYFNHFNDSSLDLVVYTFTKTTNWVAYQEIKGSILLDIAGIIARHGADIAYPTQTLKLERES